MLNRRGDRRGINGVAGVRGPNGRFARTNNPVEAVPPGMLTGEDSAVLVQHSEVVDVGCEAEDSDTTTVAMDSASTQSITVAHAIYAPIVDPILQKAQSATGIGPLTGLDYNRLVAVDVLQAINDSGALKPGTIPRKTSLLTTHVVKQCAVDRRDLGPLPYVVASDTAFNSMGAFLSNDRSSNVTIKTVSNTEVGNLKAGCEILTQRGLLIGTTAQLLNDMHVFSTPPYKLIGAWRSGTMVGVCVFRGFCTNTGQRLIHIELLATLRDVTPGVGSALMRVLRKLSQVSPLHVGHLAAFTLRTQNAQQFYDRKLPERNGPHARSMLVSMVCIDPLTSLYSHLDMRYSCVVPGHLD